MKSVHERLEQITDNLSATPTSHTALLIAIFSVLVEQTLILQDLRAFIEGKR
jgi:hypothetical protein